MTRSSARSLAWLAPAVGALLSLLTIHAFAATNAVAPPRGGEGSGSISGFATSDIDFTLDAHDPSLIASVGFDVSSEPGTAAEAQIRLRPNGAWYRCAITGARVVCDTSAPEASVAEATELRIVIAD